VHLLLACARTMRAVEYRT